MNSNIENLISPFCDPVQQLVKPMLKSLTANGFTFMRIYEDGTRIFLSDSAAWVKYFVDNNFFRISGYKKFTYIPKFTLWKHWPKEDLEFQQFMNDAKATFSHDNCLNIIQVRDNFLNSFCFRAHENNDQINNVFINNIEPIERFVEDFLLQANDIIVRLELSKILIDEKKIIINNSLKENYANISSIKTAVTHENQLLILDETGKKKLSLRESECIILRYRGLTNKLIAQKLNISQRTVEQHIENIKNKTSMYNIPNILNYILRFNKNRYIISYNISHE